MRKIKNWLVDLYVSIRLFFYQNKLEKELDKEFQLYSLRSSQVIFESDTQRKYLEGLSVAKGRIKAASKSNSNRDYEKALESIKDLVGAANNETTSQRVLRKTLERMYTHYGKDIKSDKDKRDMIDTRIEHYEELRKYNVERVLRKDIKIARKEGNEALAERLEAEWREKYGKIGDGRRR